MLISDSHGVEDVDKDKVGLVASCWDLSQPLKLISFPYFSEYPRCIMLMCGSTEHTANCAWTVNVILFAYCFWAGLVAHVEVLHTVAVVSEFLWEILLEKANL
jgi:hypothetical protein